MTTCLFIRSFRGDFEWLRYALRSIAKFVTVHQIVIAVPRHDEIEVAKFGLTKERVILIDPVTDDFYLDQQHSKLMADTVTSCDYILHSDSDCIWHTAFNPSMIMQDGKPVMLMTPYSKLPPSVPWMAPTVKALGKPVEFEHMRRQPFLYPRWAYQAFRSHIQRLHGVSLGQYIKDQPYRGFSEYNAIGAFLFDQHHDKFHWIDTSVTVELPPTFLKQYWSHGGITEEIRTEMETFLA